jgi:nucleotide-binding universal stress UspA family protein
MLVGPTLDRGNGRRADFDRIAAATDREKPARKQVIIVPFDLSPAALEAAKSGLSIAVEAQAQLILCHAIHLNLSPYGPANPARLKAALWREVMEKAEPILTAAQEAGIPAICAIEEGAPAMVITKLAERWRADLIILTTPQGGFFSRLVEHNTAEKVMREAKCPVIVLPTEPRKTWF